MSALVLTPVADLEALVRRVLREELARVRTEEPRDLPLDTAGAAREAGVTPKTIREWVAAGRLRATKRGRTLRIERADLARAMGGEKDEGREAADRMLRAIRGGGGH